MTEAAQLGSQPSADTIVDSAVNVNSGVQLEAEAAVHVDTATTLPALRKADPDNRRDWRMVDQGGNTVLTPKYLKQLCRDQGGYQTPELNDKLFLHFKALNRIAGLDEYTGLKSLWLEGNGIALIENLEPLPLLRCLYLHENCIRRMESLSHLVELDTLNLSNNLIKRIEGIETLTQLKTLQLAKNFVESRDDLDELLTCPSISVLDLSENKIDDVEIFAVLEQLPNLAVLNLMGNPVVRSVSSYRKATIARLRSLTYLDDRPVTDTERLLVEAWCRGGIDAEREERQRQAEEQRTEHLRNFEAMKRISEAGRAKRRQNYPDDPEEPTFADPAVQHLYQEMLMKVDERCAEVGEEGVLSGTNIIQQCVNDEFLQQGQQADKENLAADSLRAEPSLDADVPPVRQFERMFRDGSRPTDVRQSATLTELPDDDN